MITPVDRDVVESTAKRIQYTHDHEAAAKKLLLDVFNRHADSVKSSVDDSIQAACEKMKDTTSIRSLYNEWKDSLYVLVFGNPPSDDEIEGAE